MNIKPKYIPYIISGIFALLIIFGIIIVIVNTTVTIVKITPTPKIENGESSVVGYVYTSGLSSENSSYDYQLTYINYQKSVIEPANITPLLDGIFLAGDNSTLSSYWGKCVRITGKLPSDLSIDDISQNYFRSNMTVKTINLSNECEATLDNTVDSAANSDYYSGVVARNERPSPDKAYDYKLILTTPYKSTATASGKEELITEIVIMPMTENIFTKFQSNVGNTVTVSGDWMTGFAETNFFLVISIR
jgi:hypothetical protein